MKKSKIVLVIIMLFMTTLLSSCIFPGPGHGSRGGMHESHGNNEHHEHHEDHH